MKMKKLFALLLAVCMLASMAACAPANEDEQKPVTYVDPYAQYAEDYDKLSQEIYKDVLVSSILTTLRLRLLPALLSVMP